MKTTPAATAPAVLPAELTSFVGRRRELELTRRMLGESRLVTLTGVGGVGKTRLALRTATDVRRQFPDGAWFVELASLQDPHLLPHTVARALHLDQISADPTADVAEWLEDRHVLMVLDNCEHVVEDCATLLGKLLAAAPRLHVLATSRHVLGVEGEHILPVPPLSTPEATTPADEAAHVESVELLAERASAVKPDFRIDADDRETVAELCRRLDGLPLAIELAAVWLRTLSPTQILERLDDRFKLLTTGPRAGPARQQALDAAVAWSFDLCSPGEQLMWQRLSVFSGGFELEAAEEVCSGEGIERDNVLPLLAGLVDKSIVSRDERGDHGRSWYRMLETIRQYGAARLASTGQTRAIQLRHRDRYRRLARQFGEEFFTEHQAEWFVALRREHDNIRATLDFCLDEPGEASAALEIAAGIWNWWFAGFLREGYRYLRRALELTDEPTPVRAQGLFATSNLAIHLSEFDRALAMLAEAGGLADRFRDDVLAARVKQCQGHALIHRGDPAAAVPYLEEARDEARRLSEPREECRALLLLSLAMGFLGDRRDEEMSRRSLELAEQHGAESSRAWALWGLGLAQWHAGEYQDARGSLREGVRLFESMRNFNGVSFCVQGLAWCAASATPDESAACLLGAAQVVWRSIGGNVAQAIYRQLDERSETLLREGLGDARFEAALAEGASYSLEQALAAALGEAHAPEAEPATRVTGPGGLTRREWQIAELVAEGLSNKDIAERLVISRRTAETHIEHILTKLGFRSRVQVSRWVADQREQ